MGIRISIVSKAFMFAAGADSTHGRNPYYLEALYCRPNCDYLRESHDECRH